MSKVRHLLCREGRHYARVVVPPELRRIIGKTELREPLGADKRTAERNHHAAIARLLQQIADARRTVQESNSTPDAIARHYYVNALARDERVRFEPVNDDTIVERLLGSAVRSHLLEKVRKEAGNGDLSAVTTIVDAMIEAGEVALVKDTPAYRDACVAVLRARTEVVERQLERDKGDFSGKPSDPILVEEASPMLATVKPLSTLGSARVLSEHSVKPLSELVAMFHQERTVRPATAEEHRNAVRMWEEFIGEPKAVCEITRQDLLAYKRALLRTPSNYSKRFPGLMLPEAIEANEKRTTPFPALKPSTVRDKWLAHVRALLSWCVAEGIIPDNPASGIKVDEGAGQKDPPRVPFTAGDLTKIFGAPLFGSDVSLETRQWVLLVALHTGARAAEIAQLRLDGIRHDRGVLVFEVDGVLKNNASRRLVPVHQRLINLGLEQRVHQLREAGEARLFPDWHPAKSGKFADTLPRWFNRTYLPGLKITAAEKTFHSFRHTLKTALARAGVSRAISDAITGHADGTAGGGYIHDVSLEAMAEALNKAQFDGVEWSVIGC
jgi:integrase